MFFISVFVLLAATVLIAPLRLRVWTPVLFRAYKKALPRLSDTERAALQSGSAGPIEAAIFSGRSSAAVWSPSSSPLSDAEQAFLDGPVEQVCAMINDWDVTHTRLDLPPEVWSFLKTAGFFGLVIPKEHGGLGFSAQAHHLIIARLASVSSTLGVTVGVPNSLGPGELILHHGTDRQRAQWLPGLASGTHIPCFALTGPSAGSDATAIPDIGRVTVQDGRLGVRITFNKRYITLAPVATLIGLAFRLVDPDHLLSTTTERGITLALLQRSAPGLIIGRRHNPLGAAFMNGPLSGEVFVELDDLIGGADGIGQGWRMLVECLSVGRAITLPSMSAGAAAISAAATYAYADLRHQFNHPLNRFEGVETALAEMAVKSLTAIALSRQAALSVDAGQRPALPSAIAKQRCTELSRQVLAAAMDVEAGKGVILGPRNHLGRLWQCAPIGITVEGANIMTRSLMIFGQGVFLSHPFIQPGLAAAEADDRIAFDRVLTGHIQQVLRCALLSLRPVRRPRASADNQIAWATLATQTALLADLSLITLGGRLKIKERLSGHMADAVSGLYAAAALEKMRIDGSISATPLLQEAVRESLAFTAEALRQARRHHPSRLAAWVSSALAPWRVNLDWGKGGHRRAARALADPTLLAPWFSARRDSGHPAGHILALHAAVQAGTAAAADVMDEIVAVDDFAFGDLSRPLGFRPD